MSDWVKGTKPHLPIFSSTHYTFFRFPRVLEFMCELGEREGESLTAMQAEGASRL